MQSLRADVGFPEYAGQYRLESVLGSGGMGIVRLATSGSGLKLAVKIVHPQHAVDPEFRARFRQEVAAARRVSGAFTAPVVDADPDAERPWMATLFIDAPTLAERVRERVLDPAELTRLAAGLAEALRDIHRAGVVHRDLKPSNVLMAPDGVRVIDFGISRPADSDLRTETGKLIGTPPFMAPEQFQRPREVGSAADVFALGAVLVHAATGRGPFDSDSHYLVAYQVVHGEPDLTGLPPQLAPVIARCLSKDPAERPTADALISAMRALAYPTGEDTQTFVPQPRRPASPTVADAARRRAEEPTHQRARTPAEAAAAAAIAAAAGTAPGPAGRGRRRARVMAAAAAGLLLAGGAVGGGWYLRGDDDGPRQPAGGDTQSAAGAQKAFTPWSRVLGRPGSGTGTGTAGPAGTAPTACSWADGSLYCSGHGLAAARLDPADGSVVWSVQASPGTVETAAPLHDGGLVLTTSSGGHALRALDPATGAERWKRVLLPGSRVVPAGPRVMIALPDGKAISVDAATGVAQWTKQFGGVGSVWCACAGGDAQPGTAQPGAAQPGAAQPGAAQPGAAPALYVATPAADGKSTQVSEVDPVTGAVRALARTTGTAEPVGVAGGGLFLLENDAGAMARSVLRVDLGSRAVRSVPLSAPLLQAQAAVGPDGTAYVFGVSGALAAVGAQREEWRLQTGVTAASRPVLGGDRRVYLTAVDGRLLAVDGTAGRLAGQTRPRMGAAAAGQGGGAFTATLPAPVAAGGRVFATAPDGAVFAVAAGDPAAW
ncbi:protein kinase [Streptomyces sp. NPDC090445]|uniref:protein kinase domain-containing protein n=1 Tax=Streptomyces sp. NPDC090445 TaxID=3365963 RepID=UPI00380A9629